jgi:hypothetical protein
MPDAAAFPCPGSPPADTRLLQIEANTHERLDDACCMHWLGEVAALEESRRIADKKQQAERLRQRSGRGETGPESLS